MRHLISTAAAALLLPCAAFAFDASGTGKGTAMSKVTPLHDGLIVIDVQTEYSGFEGGSETPLSSASGPCWGSVMIDKGAVSGGGLCHYTDADDEHVVIRWNATGIDEGRTVGTWEVMGGTGKWMAASGGGGFNAGGEGDAYTNNVTGTVEMN